MWWNIFLNLITSIIEKWILIYTINNVYEQGRQKGGAEEAAKSVGQGMLPKGRGRGMYSWASKCVSVNVWRQQGAW